MACNIHERLEMHAKFWSENLQERNHFGDGGAGNINCGMWCARQRPVNSNGGTVFSVWSVPKCYQDS
jgi:hypothetical protein